MKFLEISNKCRFKKMSEIYKQGFLKFIEGTGESNLKYIDSKILSEALAKAIPYEPNDLELVAFSIAIVNPKEVTKRDVLIYGQILEILKLVEERSLEKTCISRWAAKARVT